MPVGVEVRREVCSELTHHLFFNIVRDDVLGLRIQPALGVTLGRVLAARDAISPRHQHTVATVTAFVFLNSLLNPVCRKNEGWLFLAENPLRPALDELLRLVDQTVETSGFFTSLSDIKDYIRAVEAGTWQFVAVMPSYLYALIADGQVEKAKRLAGEQRERIRVAAADRGFVMRASDTQPYDEILAIVA